MFAAGIARSWELLGLRGGGPLDLLAQRLDDPGTGPAGGSGGNSPDRDART